MIEEQNVSKKKDSLSIVLEKYPNLESKDNLTNSKLFDFRRLVDDEDNLKVIESLIEVYKSKTGNKMDADDILNIFK